jgi:hypothetical protein
MPINFKCPNGHELVTEDQYAGRQVRCPHCQLVLTIPNPVTAIVATPLAPAAVPIPDEIDDRHVIEEDEGQDVFIEEEREEDRPRRRRRERDDDEEEVRPRKRKKAVLTRQQFSLTNLGLAFHYANFLCLLVGIVLILLGFLCLIMAGVGALTGAAQDRSAAQTVIGVARVGQFLGGAGTLAVLPVSPLLGITGSILCCWVPPRTGARPLIMTSLGLYAGSLLLTLVAFLVAGTVSFRTVEADSAAALVFTLLGMACSLAGFILFLLFLRRLAFFLGDTSTGDEAMSLLIFFIILTVGGILGLYLLMALAFAAGQIAGTVILIAGIVAYSIFTIKFLQLILALIGTIRQHLRTRYNV